MITKVVYWEVSRHLRSGRERCSTRSRRSKKLIVPRTICDWVVYSSRVRPEIEDYFLNPPPGSAAARAVSFGIDLTLTLENLRLTPEQRIRKLDDRLAGIAKLRATAKRIDRPAASNGSINPRT